VPYLIYLVNGLRAGNEYSARLLNAAAQKGQSQRKRDPVQGPFH